MLKNMTITILGGVGLFLATVILNAIVSSPPSRAEFDAFKAETSVQLKNINSNLIEIKYDQKIVIKHLINRGR